MRPDIFNDTMHVLATRVLFKPFTVVLVNGNRFEIDHPSALAHRDGFAMYIAPGNVPVIFDHDGVAEVVGDLIEKADQ